jgi:hypothetical protein
MNHEETASTTRGKNEGSVPLNPFLASFQVRERAPSGQHGPGTRSRRVPFGPGTRVRVVGQYSWFAIVRRMRWLDMLS